MMGPDYDHSKLARAYGPPPIRGVIKSKPEDFIVEEELGFELTGEGEHVCLQIRKRGLNTADVARDIARLAGVRAMDVSYAGLKDKHAVTTQWFSIYLGNKSEPDWQQLAGDNVEILTITRHNRKLRRGCHKGNRFTITIRDVEGDLDAVAERIELIKQHGVPNYFGEQRFGHNNLARARDMFAGKIKVRDRNKRSIYISAARSAIFNAILSTRVEQGTWNQALPGDVMMLAGSNSVFVVDEVNDDIRRRVGEGDIFPTGLLPGNDSREDARKIDHLDYLVADSFKSVFSDWGKFSVTPARRSLISCGGGVGVEIVSAKECCVEFSLLGGQYATAFVSEFVSV